MIRPKITTTLLSEDNERFFGPGPAELLKGVRVYGSLLSSSKAMGMSYSKATRIVKRAETALGFPLLTSTIGGTGGGGSELTGEASALISLYDDMSAESAAGADDAFAKLISSMNLLRDLPRGNLSIIVLASGHSERFGEDKLTYDLLGRPVISYVLDTLSPLMKNADILVSTCSRDVAAISEEKRIRAALHSGVPLSDSIRNGLKNAEVSKGYMFIPADQPLLTLTTILELIGMWREDMTRVCRVSFKGTPGSPVIFPSSYKKDLMLLEGETGGSSVIRAKGIEPLLCEALFPWELWDIDTKEDLRYISDMISFSSK